MTDGWRGRRVLITGHTGFKGAWLSLWLHVLGAEVVGLSDGVPTTPALFSAARLADLVDDRRVDVRNAGDVLAAVALAEPEVVFHLAAQSLVRLSLADPVGTWETNVMGTINVLEACRNTATRAVVVVTSDKCYQNTGDGHPHREADPLGGNDPYSSSKAAAELATAAWRASLLGDGPAVATVRAGNVIGGGDWAADRLVPDAIRAAVDGSVLRIRYPRAVRPWQDVLDCLEGYLMVAERLLEDRGVARPWNFGPPAGESLDVASVVERLDALWPTGLRWVVDDGPHPPEAPVLVLDAQEARQSLHWRPRQTVDQSLERLVLWYAGHASGADARELALQQLAPYLGARAGAG